MTVATASGTFARALWETEFRRTDITQMFRDGYQLSEIAARVNAQAATELNEAHVAAWLTSVGGFDECGAIFGRAACEWPADPKSNPPRCRDFHRS